MPFAPKPIPPRDRLIFAMDVADPDAARRLASLPNVAEHHLTPDLKEEVIVLRNRRGNAVAGLAPLKAAMASLAG